MNAARIRNGARRYVLLIVLTALAPTASGCMVGPDFRRPDVPVAGAWLQIDDARFSASGASTETGWWRVFGDPVLDALVESAYRQNPSLAAAGDRVMEARARRGIAFGTLFPQQQEVFGAYSRVRLSEERANQRPIQHHFDDWQAGFDALWEIDIWGRLRRGVEAADAEVLASVATYDDVLLTLVAEVARNYLVLRVAEERLEVARTNLDLQQRSFDIADLKFQRGAVSRLDAVQAAALLEDTRAQIPELEAAIAQTESTLCVLLGLPPQDLDAMLARPGRIPMPPATVAVGIPAELLRRRPDIRRAEGVLAAQSARIGVAKADFLPSLALTGTIEVTAQDVADLFESKSVEGFGGPAFRWPILNYGRIWNNVRAQDARYRAFAREYENTVLRAQAEVQASIAAFLGAERQVESLTRSVEAAKQAVEISDLQYGEGAVDYTRVINTQQFLLSEENRLVSTRGAVALNLTSLYKALGGGWEIRGTDPEQASWRQ